MRVVIGAHLNSFGKLRAKLAVRSIAADKYLIDRSCALLNELVDGAPDTDKQDHRNNIDDMEKGGPEESRLWCFQLVSSVD